MFRLAVFLVLAAIPAQACHEREILAGYLASKGMPLHSWGLTSAGDMHELFMGEDGRWAVVETRPSGCAMIISTPDRYHDRLWRPPSQNRAITQPNGYRRGEAM